MSNSLSGRTRRRKRIAIEDKIVNKYMEVYNCTAHEAWRRHRMTHAVRTINAPS